jgi:hypothetical protein
MDTTTCSEVLRETDPVKQHRGNPRVGTVFHEIRSDEQIAPRIPVGRNARDERTYETYIGGAGI